MQQLELLSVFHFVVGGLLGLFACFPVIHLVIGILMIAAPEKLTGGHEEPPPLVGWSFVVFAAAAICLGWAFAVCLVLAGWFLARRSCYLFCRVMAGLACTFVPIGAVLGSLRSWSCCARRRSGSSRRGPPTPPTRFRFLTLNRAR